MEHHAWSGRVDYIHDERGERGREWFTVTTHEDGRRVVRARCEMDDTEILRDVTFTMRGFEPEEAYVRLVVKGNDVEARCESLISGGGRISQVVKTHGRTRSFGPHPVVCDCFHTSLYDPSLEEPVQRFSGILNSSLEPDGSSGPMIGEWEFGIELVGEERITVPAGTFDTLHYRFHLDNAGWEPEELWVLPGSRQLVKIYWSVLKTTYVLAELDGDPR
jgi:hypothetical protein